MNPNPKSNFMKKSLSVLLLSLATFTASTSLQAQSALQGGLVENADVFMYMDIAKMNQSPFYEAMDALQSPEDQALAEEKMAKFTKATGLTEDDIITLTFSMDIDDIDFQAQDPDELEDAQAVVAIELAKSITLDQAKAGLESMSEENEMKAELTIATVDGMDVIVLESKGGEQGPDKAFGTLSEDGKTFLMAFNTMSLKDATARITAGKAAEPTEDMSIAMDTVGDRQTRMILVLPPVARQKIKEGIETTAAQGGMGGMMMPFATAKSLIISANTTENLDFYLSLDLGEPGNAAQAAGMVQSMLPMMMMSMGPQAMELSQKIEIAPQDSVVTVSVTLTPDDINAMGEAAQADGMDME